MIRIGENINVMSKTLGPAMKERNAEPIQKMAIALAERGVDYVDVNIGPARKQGDEMMEWLVKTIHEVIDLPLSLDTTNPVAMEAGLKAHTKGGRPLINSISAQPERLESTLPMVKKYDAEMIGLLWGKEGMPRDANERAALAVDIAYRANEAGIPNEDIWIDPIATPVSGEINQVVECTTFMSMLQDICPGCKSTVGLSNISNGTADHLRHYLNRAYMLMLEHNGLHSAIVDAFDDEIGKLAKGEMPEIVELVNKMMQGEEPDLNAPDDKKKEYAKTVRVLMGKSLYSDSWLEI